MNHLNAAELAATDNFQTTIRHMNEYGLNLNEGDTLAEIMYSLALHEHILVSPTTIREAAAILN